MSKIDIIKLLIDIFTFLATTAIPIIVFIYTKKQDKLSKITEITSLKLARVNTILNWTDRVIGVMTESATFCEFDIQKYGVDNAFLKYTKIYNDLSHLLDLGRMFFPNDKPTEYGKNKESAFQGFRTPILQSIADFMDIAIKLNYLDQKKNKELQKELINAKRKFVSKAQDVIEARKIDGLFEQIGIQNYEKN